MDWLVILVDFLVLTAALFLAGLIVSWVHRRQEHRHAEKEAQKQKQESYGTKKQGSTSS